MKKFVSWLGGIVATVIAGVVVYYWTTPTPAPAPAPEIAFEGMVIDGERDAPIQSALVSFEVNGASTGDAYHDLTDEHGSYGIKLSGLSKSSTVVLHFHANGYRDESKRLASLLEDNRYDPLLTPVRSLAPVRSVARSPHPGATPAPTPTPTPTPTTTPVRPIYIKKLSVQTFQVAPAKK